MSDVQIKKKKKTIFVNQTDNNKLVDCGKLVQAGKLKFYGYASGQYIYFEI